MFPIQLHICPNINQSHPNSLLIFLKKKLSTKLHLSKHILDNYVFLDN